MTVQIDVMTTFADMSSFAEGYLERVDGTYLVLPAGVEVPDGEWVQFSVKLVDGSSVLEGVGKASGQRDHGEEYGAERYDLWVSELQLAEGMSEVAWERILLAREQKEGGDRPTGEVNLADVEAARSDAPPAPAEAEEWDKDATATYEEGGFQPEVATGEVDIGEMEDEHTVATVVATVETRTPAGAPPAAPRARPAGAAPKPAPPPPAPSGLTRPTAAVSWHPVADPPRGTGQGSGVFEYGDEGLPVPPRPPRPEGDVPRVQAAPRPAGG